MRCPQCGERETRVVDSRDLDDSATIRRRRECAACATRFTTYERVEAARLVVVKRDGTRQEFDRDKLASGLRKALTRRPVADGAAEPRPTRSRPSCARPGPTEVPSSRVGALAMEQLRAIDQIAYIRFASVYQSFEDLEDLKREVDTPATPSAGPDGSLDADERPVRPRHPRRARGRATSASTRTTRADLQPSSVDLHLDRRFRVFRNNRYAVHRRPRAAARPDRAAHDRRTTSRSSSIRASSSSARRSNGSSCPTTSSRGSRARARWAGSGLLIHSTAGYVDPGWKGNLTLELSNVANLPIALYFGMRIGQISFFRMAAPVERPYGSPELGSKYQGQSEPTASAFHRDFDRRPTGADRERADGPERRGRLARATSAAGRASRWSRPARSARTPGRCSGRCRGSCGSDLVDRRGRRRAPAPPGAQLPADRDAGRARPGRDRDRRAGRRQDPRDARLRGHPDRARAARRPASTRDRSTSSR